MFEKGVGYVTNTMNRIRRKPDVVVSALCILILGRCIYVDTSEKRKLAQFVEMPCETGYLTDQALDEDGVFEARCADGKAEEPTVTYVKPQEPDIDTAVFKITPSEPGQIVTAIIQSD